MKAWVFTDNVFSFEGSISVERGSTWVSPWRIPYERKEFYSDVQWQAKQASGVRLCFTTDSKKVKLSLGKVPDYDNPVSHAQKFDIYVNSTLHKKLNLSYTATSASFTLPSGVKEVEVWMSQNRPTYLKAVMIEKKAFIFKTPVCKPRWVHYGSSISHAGSADTPSLIWSSQVARDLGLYLTNLGYSGQCHLDGMIGRLIRDEPADYITLKLGINTYGGSLSPRTFPSSAINLIQTIREKHPTTPLTIISPIYSPPRETKKSPSGQCLKLMRENLQKIVETCSNYGDENIYYTSGLKIVGKKDGKCMPDNLHPDSDAQALMAKNIKKHVFHRLGVK